MKRLITNIFLSILLIDCSVDSTTKMQKQKAQDCYNSAELAAELLLDSLDAKGFEYLVKIDHPSPFRDSIDEENRQEKLIETIKNIETIYGKILERKFYGIHVLLEDKILTYVPGKTKEFKLIIPQKIGVEKIEDLYKENIEGTYALLMYTSKSLNKEYAEELVVMWMDNNEKWWAVDYYIDDEI